MVHKDPIRIFVVEPRGSGGMIHYAYQMCTSMANIGADVTLITAQNYELIDLPHNFPVIRLMDLWAQNDPILSRYPATRMEAIWRKVFWTVRRSLRGARLIVQWFRLTDYLLHNRPDIVQFGEIEFPFEAIFLHRLKRNGLTLSEVCHEFEKRENNRKIFKLLDNWLSGAIYQAFSIIFFHGEVNRDRFLSFFDVPTSRVFVIPHGNENIFRSALRKNEQTKSLKLKYGFDQKDCVILFFGNLTPSKGIPDLINAFAEVFNQDNRSKLVIAGMPSKFMDMNPLIHLTSELLISDAVIFDNRYLPIEDVGMLMQMATVVVFPYLSGTQSGAIQVAYSFGKPVIATNVGGFGEEVEDGRSGYLVPPSSPHLLAEAIRKVINDPEGAERMGAYARQLSETRFAWEPIVRQIIGVYSSFLENKQQDYFTRRK